MCCPVCGSSTTKTIFSKDAREYVRCQDCGLVYWLPRPTEMSLSELYDDIGEKYFTDPRMLSFYFGPHRLNVTSIHWEIHAPRKLTHGRGVLRGGFRPCRC